MSMKNKRKFEQTQLAMIQAATERRAQNKKAKEDFESVLLITCWVLHDKYGFGKDRIQRLINEVKELINDYDKGYFEAKELVDQFYKEVKIDNIKF